MSTRSIIKLLYFLLITSFFECKNDETPAPRDINLFFRITNDKDVNIAGAKLYLFNNSVDVEAAVLSTIPMNSIDSTETSAEPVSINAKLTISPDKNYWLYVKYNDKLRKLTLTNDNYKNAIGKLPKDLDVTVKIRLTPIDGNIAFWSPDANIFPITVQVEKQTYTFSQGGQPTNVLAPQGLIVNKRAGQFKYYAKNNHGCVWSGIVNLKKGELKYIEIGKCTMGQVVFWSEEANRNYFPIKIVLNNADTIGVLQNYTVAYTCGDANDNVLKTYREQGSYTYFATTSNGGCVWSGAFEVTTDQCTAVKLAPCR